MARKMAERPSKCGSVTKIMQSDGCKRDTVPVAVGQWYSFFEFGCHLGNVEFSLTPFENRSQNRFEARDRRALYRRKYP